MPSVTSVVSVMVIVARTAVTQMTTKRERVLLPSFSTSTGSSYVNRDRQRPRLPLAALRRRRRRSSMRAEDLPDSDVCRISHVRPMNVNHRHPLRRAY
uniref:Putative secreted peptide n=1 Tax=Anopheles braziliensis TaxID=58242 RepID=A0A2M3ZRU9_9DIPT